MQTQKTQNAKCKTHKTQNARNATSRRKSIGAKWKHLNKDQMKWIGQERKTQQRKMHQNAKRKNAKRNQNAKCTKRKTQNANRKMHKTRILRQHSPKP